MTPTKLVFHLDVGQDHFEDIKNRVINFLSLDIGFWYFKVQLGYIGGGDSIDFTTQVDQNTSLMQIFFIVK